MFLAPLSTKCSVSYCDHSASVGVRRPSVHIFLVYTLAYTNINRSVPTLVICRKRSIMDVIKPELSKLYALELENLPYLSCLPSSICNYKPIGTKLSHSIYDYKIPADFYHGCNRTRTCGLICPSVRKDC